MAGIPQLVHSMVIGRVRPGVAPAQAEANLNVIAVALAKEHPLQNEGLKIRLTRPGFVGDSIGAPVAAFTGGVMVLAGLVLFAACANLAGLLAARATDRQRELAIRLSMGAGRARIVRQLLTEALLLSSLGGAAGCALAIGLLRVLSQWHAPLDFPVQFAVAADARVFLFALAASLATGLLFGLGPARLVWRMDPNTVWKGALPGGIGWRRRALRDLLLALQVALCCVLVSASFVSIRGLSRAVSTPMGFDPKGVAVAGFDLGLARYTQADGRRFQRRALDSLTQIPGVSFAAYANSLSLSIDQSSTTVYPEQATDFRLSKGKGAADYQVSPGYFQTMGTRLMRGRDFTWHDDVDSPAVAVINETLARQLHGTPNAVGWRFRYGRNQPPVEVIGIVEDGKYVSLTETPRAALFRPATQPYNATTVLLVRSAASESEIAGRIRQAISTIDPDLPVYGAGSAQQMLGFAFFPARAATIALSAFGFLAVMLAVTGVYGVAAYSVSRRVREIGIRVAVGAQPRHVLQSVLGRVMALLAVGTCIGLSLGFLTAKFLSAIVYQASSTEPAVFVLVILAMGVIGFCAACVPASRALRLDPARALRDY